MISFECDYNTGAHPEILRRFAETNLIPAPGYGDDPFTASAAEKIRRACACPDAQIFFLMGGTQTNAVAISTMLSEHQGVICADTGHIGTHEAGAVEFTGHKVLPLPSRSGKLEPEPLIEMLSAFFADEHKEHMVFPGMVYISFPTELGTLYTKAELEKLSEICRRYGLILYLDGARLGYGLMSRSCDVTLPDLARICDAFYIGGTKVGALCGEALVFTRNNMPPHFLSAVKRRGALAAKGRLLGLQFDTLFTDDLYFRISRHAIDAAAGLKRLLREKGYRFYLESPTNQQFVILDDDRYKELSRSVRIDFWGKYDASHTIVRFTTSWSTSEEDLLALSNLL
ncbi:MAG: aminotransferase class V-fold PLP-dependent enzyme [Clostridia bacterium]|nr:aminotransferase class V-fold PLP-dependent enzyme [Clostridia bacterium]